MSCGRDDLRSAVDARCQAGSPAERNGVSHRRSHHRPILPWHFQESDAAVTDVLTDVALGFIAFSIGGEFRISNIKQIGTSSITITFFQACLATLLVDAALLACGFPAPLSLTLGAIAAATAPAATLMVVRQYHAKVK